MTIRLRGPLAAVAAVMTAALIGACTSGVYAETPIPTATPITTAAPSPSPSGTATSAPAACDNATQSYNPLPALTGDVANNAVAAIKARGYLIAGVSADSLRLGSRNPLSGQIEGFDIDMVRDIAQAIFGDPSKVQYVVITTAQRTDVLQNKQVDIVARAMTMNCSRWSLIAFSAEYYQAGLKVLVKKGDKTTSLTELAGKKVCAPSGSTSLTAVQSSAGVIPVTASTHTGCLVLFQQGKVDAIAGDDTVLAGLVAQDPYAYVPPMAPVTSEPYGIGVNKDQVDLVRYINRVLETVKADGRWKDSYNTWLAGALGPAPAPPQSVYGRG